MAKLFTIEDIIIPALRKDGRLEGDIRLWIDNIQTELDRIKEIENQSIGPYWYLITLKNKLTRVLEHIDYKNNRDDEE